MKSNLKCTSQSIFIKNLKKKTFRHHYNFIYFKNKMAGLAAPGRFLPPANEVWGKVIFLHLSVILFTGGVPGQVPLGRYTPWAGTSPGQVHPPDRYTPW